MESTVVCTQCVHTGYGTELWHRLMSAEWMANTGAPLLAAVAGLFVAFLFLRQQLRSDRDLRVADHRRESAIQLSAALLAASDEFDSYSESQPGWLSSTWPGFWPVSTACSRSWGRLGDSAARIQLYAFKLREAWKLCTEIAEAEDPSFDFHNQAMKRAFVHEVVELRCTADDLMGWDGASPVPLLVPKLGSGGEASIAETVKYEYRRALQDLRAVQGDQPEHQ